MSARAVGYVRVSTEEQAESGVSLDAQAERIRGYAGLYGIELAELVEDAGVSAKSLDRPGLARALALLDDCQADGLIVAKLDRLTRRVRDLDELLTGYFGDGRFSLWSVAEQIDTKSAGGRMVLNLLVTVSQWEREVISERTSASLALKQSRGELVGSIPYGRQLDADGVHLVDEPGEVQAALYASMLRGEGFSYRAIGRDLLAKGWPPRSGETWHPEQVRRLIALGKEVRENGHEPVAS